MDNIQKKKLLKKKKRILSLLNLVSSLDETTIIFDVDYCDSSGDLSRPRTTRGARLDALPSARSA